MPTENYIKLSDAAVILQGRNISGDKLNTDGRGLPYIVGASCIKDARIRCEKYVEDSENKTISRLGDIIVSVVGTLGKIGINDIGDCVLSKHICAVRFVPQILPEYGLLCVMGSLSTIIPESDPDSPLNGFQRKLNAQQLGELPLVLIGIDEQRETVEKMVLLAQCFGKAAKTDFSDENIPDDPIQLAEWFKRRSRANLNEQIKAVDKIVRLAKEPWEAVPEELQLFLEGLK
ncbi:MAG: hypothetical protein NC299_09005 [Lachnospiraceae bacterium]|nr:hypothetical protein [Lachnospiraceae bacterium]